MRTQFQPLTRIATAALVTVTTVLTFSCTSKQQARSAPDDQVDPVTSGGPLVPPRTPREQVLDIMDAKLAYTQAVLQGVVLADFGLVEHNANELAALSREARFLVEDSVAYRMLSDRFHSSSQALAEEARGEDLDAVTRGYTALIATCVDCHRHLQAERMNNDMPGRLSGLSQRSLLAGSSPLADPPPARNRFTR